MALSLNEHRRLYRERHPDKVRLAKQRYYQKHRDEIKKKVRLYKANNPEKKIAMDRAYYWATRDKQIAAAIKWHKENPEKRNAKMRRYLQAHPEQSIMRAVVARLFDDRECRKTSASRRYLGCSFGFLRNNLESLFLPGMTWENYGDWEVDHIVPISWFPFDKDPSLLFVASHWTNLRPMWKEANKRKGNRYAAWEVSDG